jgi:Na+-driven multidrug efflux pump
MLIVSSAGLIMVGLVNREGVDTAAAYGASMQLWNYLQMPAFAISSAVSAMVAQNVGAGLHARVNTITQGLLANETFTIVLAVRSCWPTRLCCGCSWPRQPACRLPSTCSRS